MEKFQIFGSKNSIDYDIMVFVDYIGSIQDSHNRITQYDKELSLIYTDKPINSNICIISDGIVVSVFKGTADEVNNSMFLTYDLHEQQYEQQIIKLVDRDIELKMLRTSRVLLSFLSRTEHRKIIKMALKGDFIDKLNVLDQIDLSTITNLNTKNINKIDYYKTMAFQLGQTLALIDGVELYSKQDIITTFPKLKTMLLRNNDIDLNILEDYKNKFVEISFGLIDSMKKLRE